MHATHRTILYENLSYILKENYGIFSEDALIYLMQPKVAFIASEIQFGLVETSPRCIAL